MTIEQSDKIDGMGIDSSKNELILLISDHLSWDEKTHVELLEAKLGGYLSFLNSGQHLATVPRAKGLPVRIRLIHEHEPNASAHTVLRAVEKQLRELNILFSHEGLHPGADA